VVERLQAIGVTVDQLTEDVSVRRCLAMEAGALRIPAGAPVLVVTREHRAGQRAVEMSEIVIPADRFTLRYRIPAGRPGPAAGAGGDALTAVPAAAPAGAGLPA
jgi:GntR family transcriptional regulator